MKIIAASKVNQLSRLLLIVLPELTNINRTHVENWVRDQITKEFVGEEMVEKLLSEVRKIFDAWELGFDPPLKFEAKSNSTDRDLFYTYDTLKRFQDAQSGVGSANALDYITYQALGLAILPKNGGV